MGYQGLIEFEKKHPRELPISAEKVAATNDDKALTDACVQEIFEENFAPAAENREVQAALEECGDDANISAFPGDKDASNQEEASDSESEEDAKALKTFAKPEP